MNGGCLPSGHIEKEGKNGEGSGQTAGEASVQK